MKNKDLQEIINNKIIVPIQNLKVTSNEEKEKLKDFFNNKVLSSNNKEEMLLQFRRGIEMLINQLYIVTVTSKTSNKIIAVRDDNVLQLLDDRYYSKVHLSSFMDLFRIETNDFKSLNIVGEPHIKLIINYILVHYNTTFRKFMNRNSEYFYIYKFFFDYGEDVKYLLSILNSYHYSEDVESNMLYNVEFSEVKNKVAYVYERICELLEKIYKKNST